MKIFVTGATGFIGNAFCRETLRRGHQILALIRDPKAPLPPEVQIAIGTLADTPWKRVEAFSPDAALHLAWTAEPGTYLHSPENEVWLEQSKSWFRHLIEIGVPYIAGTGTCIEYAPSTEPLSESQSPLGPQFPYSNAKVRLFEWLETLSTVDWAWFRIFYPYGKGEHPNRFTSTIIRKIERNQTVAMNTPHSTRDYIEVSDVASALVTSIEHHVTGPINVGTGKGVTIESIAKEIAQLLEGDPLLLQMSLKSDPDPFPVIIANIDKLRGLGWKPRVDLTHGLQSLIESLRLQN